MKCQLPPVPMPKAEAYEALAPETPPAPANAKKTRRVLRKKAAQPKPVKKYAWLAGHVVTLVFGTIYTGLYAARWFHSWWWTPLISYRLAFVGVITSYTVTVLTTFGTNIPGYSTLLATENFQGLLLAGIWLISRNSVFKLFPYYVISLLQLGLEFNVKPVLNLETQLSHLIAFSELVVIFALLFDTLLFRGTSGFAWVIYLGFYWLRVNFSPYTQFYIFKIVDFIDEKFISKQKPDVQKKWQKVKDFMEFRRLQFKEAMERENVEIPDTYKSKLPENKTQSNSHKGKPIGKTESFQVVGSDPNVEQVENKGVQVGKTKVDVLHRALDTGKPPGGLGKNNEETYNKNFNAGFTGAVAAASAGFSTGVQSVTGRAGLESVSQKKTPDSTKSSESQSQEQHTPKEAPQQTPQPSLETSSSGKEIVTPASGRISQPSAPRVSSYEKPSETIPERNRVQIAAEELSNQAQQSDEYRKLREIQQKARNEISQTQGKA